MNFFYWFSLLTWYLNCSIWFCLIIQCRFWNHGRRFSTFFIFLVFVHFIVTSNFGNTSTSSIIFFRVTVTCTWYFFKIFRFLLYTVRLRSTCCVSILIETLTFTSIRHIIVLSFDFILSSSFTGRTCRTVLSH